MVLWWLWLFGFMDFLASAFSFRSLSYEQIFVSNFARTHHPYLRLNGVNSADPVSKINENRHCRNDFSTWIQWWAKPNPTQIPSAIPFLIRLKYINRTRYSLWQSGGVLARTSGPNNDNNQLYLRHQNTHFIMFYHHFVGVRCRRCHVTCIACSISFHHYPTWYCQLNIIITITSLNSTWLLNLCCSYCASCVAVYARTRVFVSFRCGSSYFSTVYSNMRSFYYMSFLAMNFLSKIFCLKHAICVLYFCKRNKATTTPLVNAYNDDGKYTQCKKNKTQRKY